MDSVFRSAKEKLEKEHRESKETGKLKLEREKKDKEAAERQRRAVEAAQRAKRLEAIEAQMKVEGKKDVMPRKGGDCIIQAMPPWIAQDEDHDEEFFKWDGGEECTEWEVGDSPGTEEKKRRVIERLLRRKLEFCNGLE